MIVKENESHFYQLMTKIEEGLLTYYDGMEENLYSRVCSTTMMTEMNDDDDVGGV